MAAVTSRPPVADVAPAARPLGTREAAALLAAFDGHPGVDAGLDLHLERLATILAREPRTGQQQPLLVLELLLQAGSVEVMDRVLDVVMPRLATTDALPPTEAGTHTCLWWGRLQPSG